MDLPLHEFEWPRFAELYSNLRRRYDEQGHAMNTLRVENEMLARRVQELEDAAAGIKKRLHYLKRIDGAQGVMQYHRTYNGTHPACSTRFADTVKFQLVELDTPPDGLCGRCGGARTRQTDTERTSEKWLKGIIKDINPAFNTYVYVFRAKGENRYKVGKSTNVDQRMRALRHAAGVTLEVVFISQPCTDYGARDAEYEVRRAFDSRRLAQEWYSLGHAEQKRVRQIIEDAVIKDRTRKPVKS